MHVRLPVIRGRGSPFEENAYRCVGVPGRVPAGECREPEVRIISRHIAASTVANFGFKSGARIIHLPVSFSLPTFARRSRQMLANVGIGALAVRYPRARRAESGYAVPPADRDPRPEARPMTDLAAPLPA